MDPIYSTIRADGEAKLAAVTRARTHFETLARLGALQTKGSLTTRQQDDLATARVHFNDEARSLGLAEIRNGEDWGDAELEQVERTLYGKEATAQRLIDAADRQPAIHALSERVRARIGDTMDPTSGHAGGARPADEIRALLEARERQHDFDFMETDQIRALPAVDADEVRAISNFANGPSLYVSDFAFWVAMYARTESPWLGLATVTISDNGRPLVVPTLTGDVTVYTPGEGTAITPSDATLGTVTVSPSGFKALTYVSREAFDDESVNLTQLLARSHARAIGIAFGSAATTTVLAGINNGGTATGVGGDGTATVAFFGYEDLIDLQLGRAAPYRPVGSWVLSNGAIKQVRKFKDAQGAYLWPTGNLPIGGAVSEDPALAAPGSATKSVCYGDWASALIVKATPIRVELSSDFLFDKDQVAIKTVQRISLAVQDPAAAAYLVSANS